MSDTDILVNEFNKKKLIVQGKEFEVGKLSINQVLLLTKQVSKIILQSADRFKKLDTTGKEITTDLLQIFEVLSETEIAEVLSIVLKCDDKEFCKNIPAEDVTEIIAIVCEINDFSKILKNVQRTVTATKKK